MLNVVMAVVVMMIVAMVMAVVVMIVVAIVVVHMSRLAMGGVEELRLQFDDPVQIEPATAQDRVKRHVGALGAMDRG